MQQPAFFSQTRLALCVAFSLFLAALIVFWPALNHEFVNFDDDKYIVLNEQMRSGSRCGECHWQDRLQPEFHNSVGIVYFNQGGLSEAEKQFRDALRLNAAHAGARRYLERLVRARGAGK